MVSGIATEGPARTVQGGKPRISPTSCFRAASNAVQQLAFRVPAHAISADMCTRAEIASISRIFLLLRRHQARR